MKDRIDTIDRIDRMDGTDGIGRIDRMDGMDGMDGKERTESEGRKQGRKEGGRRLLSRASFARCSSQKVHADPPKRDLAIQYNVI